MPRLSTIIGHEIAVSRLRSSLENGAVGHAYLFAGPSGVGKTTTARAFAKALNCERAASLIGGPADSCDLCSACRQADAGVHPDIHIVRPALIASEAEGSDRRVSTEILISQIREMRRMINLSPSVGRRKVFIVTPADAMNEQAQNALLKSLEEPPEACTLILCAESAESILATIQSRCQVLRFGTAPRALIQLRLRELFGLTEDDAAIVAALAQGRVGMAIRLAGEPAWRDARRAMLDLVEAALSNGPLNALQSVSRLRDAASQIPILIDRLSGGDTEAASEKMASRVQLQLLFEELAVLARDLLVLRSSDNRSGADLLVNLDRLESLRRLAARQSEPMLRRALDSTLTAQDLLRRNVNPQLLLEDLMLEFTWEEGRSA
ncbi:MAG: DNA polymerase III subunit delta' [Chloroflexi bacterium]|nr:DNA polymerase III subunit delta' [Chloroflexota bacterium]